MARLSPLNPEQAPERAREALEGIIERNGTAGPMVRAMAHSSALLTGYLELSRAMKRAKLPRTASEKVSLAVQQELGCEYCLAAHTDAARSLGLREPDIELARQGTAKDPAEAALLFFALRVLTEPASLTDDDVEELRALGWSDREIAEVPGLVALNVLTGAFNLVAGIEPERVDDDVDSLPAPAA